MLDELKKDLKDFGVEFDVWFSDKMYEIRKKLTSGDRDFSPCKKCSVNGQLFGRNSFEIINK